MSVSMESTSRIKTIVEAIKIRLIKIDYLKNNKKISNFNLLIIKHLSFFYKKY